jgi:hypothetical protein
MRKRTGISLRSTHVDMVPLETCVGVELRQPLIQPSFAMKSDAAEITRPCGVYRYQSQMALGPTRVMSSSCVAVPDHFRPFAADGTLLKTLANCSFLGRSVQKLSFAAP